MKNLDTIAIDFDGTIVEHMYPLVGDPVPGAIETIKKFQKYHQSKIILWTMRSDNFLDDAVEYLKQNNIELWGINENPNQHKWTNSRKVYAPVYIDDAAFGCPLIYPTDGGRAYVDWGVINDHYFGEKL